MKQLFIHLLKIVAGLILLVLSLRGIEWQQLSGAFQAVNLGWLLGLFVSMICGLLLKIIRWSILMKRYGLQVSFRQASEAYFFGQVVNILLPTRGGDVVRLGIVSTPDPASVPRVTATIALEKFIDLVALALIALAVAAYLPPEASHWLRTWLLPASGLLTLGLTVMIFLGPILWTRFEKFLHRFTNSWLDRIVEIIDKFVTSSLWLRKFSNFLPALGLTILIWVFMWLNSLILFQALSLNIPATAGGLVLVLGYIRSALQLPPGSVGPFYFFAQLGVTTFGASAEQALVFAVLLHALVMLTPILASGFLLVTSADARKLLRKLSIRKND